MAPDSFVNNLDYATIAYDAATGAQKWIARFDGSVHGNEIATAMVLSSDGNSLYVTGGGTEEHYLDYLTVAYQVGAPLLSVVSRKTHGDAGTYDVDLPLTGAHGIECRGGGANGDYTLIFTFAKALTGVDHTVVVGIAAAYAIAVTADTKAIMRARSIAKIAADHVPAYERAEVMLQSHRVHVGAAVKGVECEVRTAWRRRNGVGIENTGARRTRRRVGVSP